MATQEDSQVTDSNVDTDNTNTETQSTETGGGQTETLEQAQARIAELEAIKAEAFAERDKYKKASKKFEKEQADALAAKQLEQGEYKDLLEVERKRNEELSNKVRNRDVDSALNASLKELGITDDAMKTALKLVDKSSIEYDYEEGVSESSLKEAVETLRKEHEILFNVKPKTPAVKRAAEGSDSGYMAELKALRTQPGATAADIDALRAKYGR